jgi:hypothetical protein
MRAAGFALGTSKKLINDPPLRQPTRNSQVFGRYTTIGS